MEHEVRVTASADVLVHVVPVEVLQLFGREVDSGNLVGVMVWRMEAITIVDVDWRVRMSWTVSRDFDLRARQRDFVEDSSDRQQVLFDMFGCDRRHN